MAAVLLAVVAPPAGKARNLSPPADETGYPIHLINRPVCCAHPAPDDSSQCIGGAQGGGIESWKPR
jgi:hypothetical protein